MPGLYYILGSLAAPILHDAGLWGTPVIQHLEGGTQEDPDLHGQPHLCETLSQIIEIIISVLFGVGENVKYEQKEAVAF